MSFAFINDLFEFGDGLSSSEFWVLMAICHHVNASEADRSGSCFPSTARISAKAHVSELTVRKTIKALEAKGLIKTSQPSGGRRTFIVSLDAIRSLPGAELLKDPKGGKDLDPPKDVDGGKEVAPPKDVEGDPVKIFTSSPSRSLPTPLKDLYHEHRKEQGKEQGREQGSFSPAFACDAPADGVAHKTGVTPCAADWASLLSETAPADDVPPGLFDDLPPEPAPVAKPAAKKPKRSRAASDAWPVEGDGIDEETRSAYLAVRKAKRVGPFTAKAYEQIKAQGEKFGRSIAETIGVCIGRGWVYPYDSALQQSNSTNGKNNGIQDDRRGFVLTPQSEYDYEAGLRMFEERRAARRARDA